MIVLAVTSGVPDARDTGPTMENLDYDYSTAVAVAILLAVAKVLPILFATLRIAISEYAAFREWLERRTRDTDGANV